MKQSSVIGTVFSGSLNDGFSIRLFPTVLLADMKTGKFVCIETAQGTFFCLVTDLALAVTNPDIFLFPPSAHETLLQKVLHEKDMYATAHIKPMLFLEKGSDRIVSVKTIPAHFSSVRLAHDQDISKIFGKEKDQNYFFHIGNPIDMDSPVCLDLQKLTERSNGIFGKTGTGKTFLTRLILAGLMKKDIAVNLIFDMHNEYGLQARQEGCGAPFVKGLKTLFGNRVAIFSLDPESTRRRGGSADVILSFNYQSIHVDDILSLQYELNLHATAIEAAYLLVMQWKQNWLRALFEHADDMKSFAHSIGAHPESLAALYRKLKRIERFSFFSTDAQDATIDQILEYVQKGVSVIIEFGNFTSTFCYLLVANMITRRIHQAYITKTENYLASHKLSDRPRQLMITIEEAHKFLNTQAARQTIFGTIAREMRKYYVSLLVVDQRPSGIDPEIISQIGTKIIAQLHDEKDVQAVLAGASHSAHLRTILATLESKKQAFLIGHAVPMPLVIQTREYDNVLYQSLNESILVQNSEQLIKEIYS